MSLRSYLCRIRRLTLSMASSLEPKKLGNEQMRACDDVVGEGAPAPGITFGRSLHFLVSYAELSSHFFIWSGYRFVHKLHVNTCP